MVQLDHHCVIVRIDVAEHIDNSAIPRNRPITVGVELCGKGGSVWQRSGTSTFESSLRSLADYRVIQRSNRAGIVISIDTIN